MNGAAGYSYQVTAIDGQFNKGTATDKYRIRIWNTATSAVVYDNQMGSASTAAPLVGISGGSIILATGTAKREMADEPVVTDRITFRVYPNPFGEEIIIRHDSDSEADIRIELVDLTGRTLRQSEYAPALRGEYVMPVGDLGLSSGFYVVRLSQGGEGKVVKVMKR